MPKKSPAATAPNEPKQKFRGTFNRKEVHIAVRDGKITFGEAWLLATIDSLEDDGEIEGCWATYSYLAGWLKITSRQVINMVNKLKNIGFVIELERTKLHGRERRVLITKWSELNTCSVKSISPGRVKSISPNSNSSSKNSLSSLSPRDRNAIDGGTKEGGNMPPLTDVMPSRSKAPVSDFDRQAAARLIGQVCKHNRLAKPYRPSAWANHIRLLRETDHVDESRILAALESHERHGKDRYFPSIQSAASFRSKFAQIEAYIARQGLDPTSVKLSAEAKSVASHIDHLGWPGPTKKDLPALIQVTLDNYAACRKAMQAYADKNPASIRVGPKVTRSAEAHVRLCHYLLDALPSAASFATEWARQVFERLSYAAEKGNLKNWNVCDRAFKGPNDLDSKVFSEARSWSDDVPRVWAKLRKEVWR